MFTECVRFILIKLGFIKKPDFLVSVINFHPSPEEIDVGRLYLVKGGAIDKWACFKCPGNCGETIKLSLSKTRRPRWTVLFDWLRRPTIKPSVMQMNECRCHFWLTKGSVQWCTDTGVSQKSS